jgi:hypothetical protein
VHRPALPHHTLASTVHQSHRAVPSLPTQSSHKRGHPVHLVCHRSILSEMVSRCRELLCSGRHSPTWTSLLTASCLPCAGPEAPLCHRAAPWAIKAAPRPQRRLLPPHHLMATGEPLLLVANFFWCATAKDTLPGICAASPQTSG